MTAIEILLALILIVLFFGLPRERRTALLKFLFWSAMIMVIAAIVAGYSNKQMARHFALSESTIYRRALRILSKVGAANRFELILVAIFYGISGNA